ncbi:MAG: hypothetical protein ISR69_00465 [Gammaproteobacteria bacterium]|nr:hypothetical protein [Gammaproteobacteria bacterium]
MSKLIFNLKSVPYDEADDIRNLLTENGISFFESPPGNWGVSVHALWLNDDAQRIQAKELIDEYQLERSKRMEIELQEKKDNGEYETFFQRLSSQPVGFTLLLAIILFILYVSIIPYFGIA